MIAKHVPMRSLGKSDFAGLVKYITADQAKEHRIGEVRLTNCAAHTVRDAVTEVHAAPGRVPAPLRAAPPAFMGRLAQARGFAR